MSSARRSLTLFSLILLLASTSLLYAQGPYTSIVVFGDSLSDTGNVANLTKALYTAAGQVPGPFTGYTDGRFTDGTDTSPPPASTAAFGSSSWPPPSLPIPP